MLNSVIRALPSTTLQRVFQSRYHSSKSDWTHFVPPRTDSGLKDRMFTQIYLSFTVEKITRVTIPE